MEQNLPLMTKKAWGIVRVLFFMLRKGIISKRKLLLDLNMLMKRGNKIASKAIGNFLIFNHHRNDIHSGATSSSSPPDAYEFSCSNTPNYTFHLPTTKRSFLSCAFHAPPTKHDDNDNDLDTVNAVKMALEMFNYNNSSSSSSSSSSSNIVYAPSPMLPGFGKSPVGRQLRITDSPFPLREEDHGDNGVVDRKAGEFIANFYRELQKQRGIMD